MTTLNTSTSLSGTDSSFGGAASKRPETWFLHDIRNLLNSLTLNVYSLQDVVRQRPSSSEGEETVVAILNQCKRDLEALGELLGNSTPSLQGEAANAFAPIAARTLQCLE